MIIIPKGSRIKKVTINKPRNINEMRKIESVTVFVSERIIQTIVFDFNEKQITDFQGSNFENWKGIILNSHTTTKFYLGVFRQTSVEIDAIIYEKLAKAFIALHEGKEIKIVLRKKKLLKSFIMEIGKNEKEII